MQSSNNLSHHPNIEAKEAETLKILQQIYEHQKFWIGVRLETAKVITQRPHTFLRIRRFRDTLESTDNELHIATFAAKRAKYFSNTTRFDTIFDDFSELKKGICETERILNKDSERNEIDKILCLSPTLCKARKTLSDIIIRRLPHKNSPNNRP